MVEEDSSNERLHEVFSKFKDDPENDFVDPQRLLEMLQISGRNPSKRDCERRIEELEAEGKDRLYFDNFLKILDEAWTSLHNDRSALREALEKFDREKKGYFEVEQFRNAMRTYGEPLSDGEIDELIQLGSNDDEGRIKIDYLLEQLMENNAG